LKWTTGTPTILILAAESPERQYYCEWRLRVMWFKTFCLARVSCACDFSYLGHSAFLHAPRFALARMTSVLAPLRPHANRRVSHC
jgi:hypothetical protein